MTFTIGVHINKKPYIHYSKSYFRYLALQNSSYHWTCPHAAGGIYTSAFDTSAALSKTKENRQTIHILFLAALLHAPLQMP